MQSELQEMQDQWWQDKPEEVQSYAGSHKVKKFFSFLKTVYDLSKLSYSPLLSSEWHNTEPRTGKIKRMLDTFQQPTQ